MEAEYQAWCRLSRTRMKEELPVFIVHHSSFILHPSSFILHPSSFILHPSSLILHLSPSVSLCCTVCITSILGERDKCDKCDATRWSGWDGSINMSLVTPRAPRFTFHVSRFTFPASPVHLSLVIHTTETHQFSTGKLPVPDQKVASSGPESCQLSNRKLPVFHSFARLSRSCMKTVGKRIHLTRALVPRKPVSSRHNVRGKTRTEDA